MAEEILAALTTSSRPRSLWLHIRCAARSWRYAGTVFGACFGAFWTAAEASSYAFSLDLHDGRVLVATLVIAFVIAAALAARRYWITVPDGFQHESRASQRIAHLRRPYWEYRLCRQLLIDQLASLDRAHAGLLEGKLFVPLEQRLGIPEYINWSQLRLESITKMLEIAKALLADLLRATCSTKEAPTDPATIQAGVERVAVLYEETILFERRNRAVLPPQGFASLHALQQNWTEPIRVGMRGMLGALDAILATEKAGTKKGEVSRVAFSLVFPEPPNIHEYESELARLGAALPALLEEEGFGDYS